MIIYQKGSMIATGRLSKDAEFKIAGERQSHFCNLSIPADVKPDGETVWVNVSCAFELADAVRFLKKNDRVLVCGKLETRSYTGRDGEEKTTTQLKADFVLPMGKNPNVNELAEKFPGVVNDGNNANQFADLDDGDGELPF